MFKSLAITIMILAAMMMTEAKAQAAQPPSSTEQEDEATNRAKQALADRLKLALSDIELVKIAAKTWNDSSLGCGKQGSMAMQVITPGYVVILNAQGREHEVHVAQNHTVICDRRVLSRKQSPSSKARGLDMMMQQAKDDLARQLGVDAARIRIAGLKPTEWQDSAMECPAVGDPLEPGPISGYKLSLRYLQRVYTYHTDMKTVRACPAIARE